MNFTLLARLFFALSLAAALGMGTVAFAAVENSKLPTKLPQKGPSKKRKVTTKVNFEENSGTHITTVVVRTPLPLEQALEDQTSAAQATENLRQPLELTAEPSLRYRLSNKVKAAPQPRKSLLLDDMGTTASNEKIEVSPPAAPTPETLPIVAASTSPTPAPTPPPAAVAVEPTPAPAPVPVSTPTISKSESSVSTTVAAPAWSAAAPSVNRLLLRETYLDAHYNELEAGLQNGANSFGFGAARQFDSIEGRLMVEAGFSMDQQIAAQNVRYLILRADAAYFFMSGMFKPFAAVGLGFGTFNVRSQRFNPKGRDLIYREHVQGSAFLASPTLGLRFDFTSFAVDASAEYLAVAGAGSTTALGGAVGAITLSVPF